MTARHILSRYERMRGFLSLSRAGRILNQECLFLPALILCDKTTGVCAGEVAQQTAQRPSAARRLLRLMVEHGLATEQSRYPAHGGPRTFFYQGTPELFKLLDLKALTGEAAS